MTSFNVLDREQCVHRHLMLEASAGTGKTFAIENLVVRLLLETAGSAEPIDLNRILVVTFTKAATRDLKVRIRDNLDRSLSLIKRFQSGEVIQETVPDYLCMYQENGSAALINAQRRIETALFAFDQAKIFTIHGFCWRMLQAFAIEGGISLKSSCSEEQTLSKTRLLRVVRDFMRTELVKEVYSSQQIDRVLTLFGGQPDKLQLDLLQVISRGLDIAIYPSYNDYAQQFFNAMRSLAECNYSSEKILFDFMLHVPAYKGICNRSKQIHPNLLDSVTRFAKLFDKNAWTTDDFDMLMREGLILLEILAPEQLAAKGTPPSRGKLHYPDFLITLEEILAPIIHQARDPHTIFARMAGDCQKLLRHYQIQEELLGFNDLLQQMQQAMQAPLFGEHVRASFDAVIVDEFQDTDPLQWEIFRRLFAISDWKGYMYLVGDPKQSIYAFRQADIYTYLAAAKALEEGAGATLNTNFRSQPPLVEALNVLFNAVQDLFPLPREKLLLPYRLVKAGKKEEKRFSDQGPSLQFLLAQPSLDKKRKITLQEYENSYFFPMMAKEIVQLHTEGIEFNRCAVLVADRFQAERLLDFFQEAGVPAISQRGNNLAESMAVYAMRELLQGIMHFRRESILRVALGGHLIGMTYDEILALEDPKRHEDILRQCEQLRKVFLAEGFSIFYPQLMQSCWHEDGKCILQRLLERLEGVEFYLEWQDIAELLIQEQAENHLSAEGLIAFLDELDILAVDEDERVKQSVDHEQDGVVVLTSHVSKGLEFDIVFSLGLIKRSPQKEKLMPVHYESHLCLEAIANKKDPVYKKYCEELDAEKMRQLYVALTRAKYRLYIPVAISCGGEEVEIGSASPIELFLARLDNGKRGGSYLNYDELYARIHAYDAKLLYEFVAGSAADISIIPVEETTEKFRYSAPQTIPALLAPPELILDEPPLFMQSFTSLAHGKSRLGNELNEEIVLAPHDFNAIMKSAHTLPAGSETGILLHTIFENLPFDVVKRFNSPNKLIPWIQPLIQKTPFESWLDVFADIVFKVLKTPLIGSEPLFCLADVNPKKMLRESDFLFASPSAQNFGNTAVSPGYIKGVIDLFFEHEGKYYLLDWKSNWLGPSEKDYQHEKLLAVMEEQDYGLQAQIYVEGLRRYLKLFDARPFEELFGGIYYIFLRGVGILLC
ncbi:MAG: UvrD-helicase domain-containing protein [Parachlamydiaceae bacterium]|nr:UvrD-helicase domain-containing protein [Parachlamydiaceae bacterium]